MKSGEKGKNQGVKEKRKVKGKRSIVPLFPLHAFPFLLLPPPPSSVRDMWGMNESRWEEKKEWKRNKSTEKKNPNVEKRETTWKSLLAAIAIQRVFTFLGQDFLARIDLSRCMWFSFRNEEVIGVVAVGVYIGLRGTIAFPLIF